MNRPDTSLPAHPALRALIATLVVVLLAAITGVALAGERSTENTASDTDHDAAQVTLLESAIARGIDKRAPVDPAPSGSRIDADLGERLWLWLSIANPGEETAVELVWKQEGKVRWTVSLEVGHSSKKRGWRTWASKTVRKGDHGRWTVDVIAPDGTLLETVSFELAPRTEPHTASAN